MEECECQNWCRGPHILWYPHHERCEKAQENEKYICSLLCNMINGIEKWASEEDGIPEELWPTYKLARMTVGMR